MNSHRTILQYLLAVAVGLLASVGALEIGLAWRGTGVIAEATRVYRMVEARTRVRKAPAELVQHTRGPLELSAPPEFWLTPETAQRVSTVSDPAHERWCDIAGNFYSAEFSRDFSYDGDRGRLRPEVLLRIQPVSDTMRGRIEIKGAKPNFCYQLKLYGDYDRDPVSFERIGYHGRWRLPGRATNYKDEDYRKYPDKSEVEAYILFDFVVTDAQGNAAHEFALEQCRHVIWNTARQRSDVPPASSRPFLVDASDPTVYARPKAATTVELLWMEPEPTRLYGSSNRVVLPEGLYEAALVLTEESFHSKESDGGHWATIARVPVRFQIARGGAEQPAPDAPDVNATGEEGHTTAQTDETGAGAPAE